MPKIGLSQCPEFVDHYINKENGIDEIRRDVTTKETENGLTYL
jgi:hypothetical protein